MAPTSRTLAHEVAETRAVTDSLFSCIDPEAIYHRPIPERHRMIFYLGHLEAFDWNLMKYGGMSAVSPNPGFDHLFAFGIDPEPGKLPSDTPADWPSFAEVQAYSRSVRETLDRELAHAPEDLVQMLIEHRHMHAETFAYIMHNLDASLKHGESPAPVTSAPSVPTMVEIPAGEATLGREQEQGFGWDNEFRQFSVQVPAFGIDRYKVTNREYLDFVREGGPVPHYWVKQNGGFLQRGMFQDFPLPLDWPVYATWDQAAAFAKWRGAEIPTEPQYHRAAFGTPAGSEQPLPWSSSPESATELPDANFGYRRWDPVAVDATPAADSPFGVAQTIGNGWEWTSTLFAPFEGFAPSPAYPGYSANFFDGKHYVLKGASPRTADRLVRRSLRNWFRPEYPYVYATFRLAHN